MKAMTTVQLMDRIKKTHGIQSDYQLAKFLGVTQQSVSNWRRGKSAFDDEIALKVADLLGLDRGQVLAWVHAERCKNPEARRALLRLADLAKTAAFAAFTMTYLMPFLPEWAGHCILC